ncbi:MAG: HAD family hydrolase [Betaproteobacteria bacterium]|nr:HAD family phosphatase [Rubrivivax sp.]MCZ8176677.1 HAD family phosphatase [Burkholderiaceae bacterium]
MKRIVFDLGAVVLRWRPHEVLRQALPQRVAGAADAAHWATQVFQGYGGDWADYDRGTVAVPDLVARIAARTGLAPAEVQAVVDGVPEELQPLPDSVALIERLRAAGHRLHYLSNMPAPCADVLERREAALFAHFDGGVFSGRVQRVKPEPAIYALAAGRFGAAPEELVFLDDHEPNVAAARAAGWQGVHFRDAAQAEAALRAGGWLA